MVYDGYNPTQAPDTNVQPVCNVTPPAPWDVWLKVEVMTIFPVALPVVVTAVLEEGGGWFGRPTLVPTATAVPSVAPASSVRPG